MISGTGNSFAGKRMLPFFSYDFYTFEVRSATAQSANPFFDSIKRFEIEQTADFQSYIKNEVLKIDLIDEGVDYTDANLRDYIGSVRIPLRDLLVKGALAGVFPVQDESRNACGYLNVKISIHDVIKVENNHLLQGAEGMAQARKATAEVVKQVAEALAMTKFEDIDLLLDMLFVKESSDQGGDRATKDSLREFIKDDMDAKVDVRDLDIFLSTNEILQGKLIVTRQMLKSVFEAPFREARTAMIEKTAGQTT